MTRLRGETAELGIEVGRWHELRRENSVCKECGNGDADTLTILWFCSKASSITNFKLLSSILITGTQKSITLAFNGLPLQWQHIHFKRPAPLTYSLSSHRTTHFIHTHLSSYWNSGLPPTFKTLTKYIFHSLTAFFPCLTIPHHTFYSILTTYHAQHLIPCLCPPFLRGPY